MHSPKGLVARLRAQGQRVVAFGPADGPTTELIHSSGLDGWVEGPPLNPQQLLQVLGSVQALKKQAFMSTLFGGEGSGIQAVHRCWRLGELS